MRRWAGEVRLSRLEELRAKRRAGERTLFEKYSERVARVEGLRPLFGIVGLFGALFAAIGRAFEGDVGLGLTIAGATVAALGGGHVLLMDYKKLEISQDAKDAHRDIEEALDELEKIQRELGVATEKLAQANGFDQRRLARLAAFRRMIESVEAALLSGADAKTSAQKLLENSVGSLRRAVDYRAGDFLTFTIFQCDGPEGDKSMVPIAREWTDKIKGSELGRSWKLGDGYTGALWAMAVNRPDGTVIEADTRLVEARNRYRVPNADAAREARYVSVVSFPILIGRDNQVWGAVTATSDRAGVFDHQGDLPWQSVETVGDLAHVAGLLAKLEKPAS